MLPRRSWSGPGPRFVASTRRGKVVTPDPLEALRLPIVPVEPRPEFAASLLRRLGRGRALVSGRGAAVEALHARGVRFRHEIVTSVGVRQALLEDPSGNPVELFEPLAGYHERTPGGR